MAAQAAPSSASPEAAPESDDPPVLEPLAAAVAAARDSYLASVHATGLPSELKAERRWEAFLQAASELGALGPGAIPLLVASLEAETDPHARLLLLTGISRIGGEAGIAGTLQALEEIDDPTIEPLFLDRLARSSSPDDERLLEAVLLGGDSGSRSAALGAAVSRCDARAARLLPDIVLHDPDPLLRLEALLAGEPLGASLDARLLAGVAIHDPSPEVRAGAVRAYASSYPDAFLSFAREAIAWQSPGSDGAAAALVDALIAMPGAEATALLEDLVATAPATEALRAAEAARRRLRAASAGKD